MAECFNIIQINVSEPWKDLLFKEIKKYEVRLYRNKFTTLQIGDLFSVDDKCFVIEKIQIFGTFRDMFKSIPLSHILPGFLNVEDALIEYQKFYTPEEINTCAVIAFKLNLR